MPQKSQEDIFVIKPSWKQFFSGYTISVLTIPFFGLGLIALYFVRKKHLAIQYEISDIQITRTDARYQHNIDLIDIENVQVQETWLQKKLAIGDLILQSSSSQMVLAGLEDPQQLKDILEKAIKSEIKRREEHQKTKANETKYQPGSMEKMNYLTGLWQQGLISEEDYEKERKHFE